MRPGLRRDGPAYVLKIFAELTELPAREYQTLTAGEIWAEARKRRS
jgi:hypothetical protein